MCLLGITNLECSPAAAFCEKIFGRTATEIASAAYSDGVGSIEAHRDVHRCQYLTHYWAGGLHMAIFNDTLLRSDGTTDGGCSMRSKIPKDDPQGLCPNPRMTAGIAGCGGHQSQKACSSAITGSHLW